MKSRVGVLHCVANIEALDCGEVFGGCGCFFDDSAIMMMLVVVVKMNMMILVILVVMKNSQ